MTYHYEIGAVRWKRVTWGDPRAYRPPAGWSAFAEILEYHPISSKPFKRPAAQWWIREEYTG